MPTTPLLRVSQDSDKSCFLFFKIRCMFPQDPPLRPPPHIRMVYDVPRSHKRYLDQWQCFPAPAFGVKHGACLIHMPCFNRLLLCASLPLRCSPPAQQASPRTRAQMYAITLQLLARALCTQVHSMRHNVAGASVLSQQAQFLSHHSWHSHLI